MYFVLRRLTMLTEHEFRFFLKVKGILPDFE